MRAHFRRAFGSVRQTYRAEGLSGAVRQLHRSVLAALYHRDTQYIFVRKIETRAALAPRNEVAKKLGVTCMVVESAAVFREMADEIPLSIRDSVGQLQQRLTQNCSVIVARRPKSSGTGHEVIAYAIYEPGVFSALGRTGRLPPDILFNHHIEVLPEYRGQRIADVIRRTSDEYCRMHGFTKRCSVISPSNEASVRSTLRSGLVQTGTVARVSLLGGLFVWETPWKKIERAVQAVDQTGDRRPRSRRE